MRNPFAFGLSAVLLISSNQVAAQSDCSAATNNAKQFEVSARASSTKPESILEHWTNAIRSWEQAAIGCSGREQEAAKDAVRRATEEKNKAERILAVTKCNAAEEVARQSETAGAALFKEEKWSESAQAYRNAANQFKTGQSACDLVSPGRAKSNIEIVEKNAEIANRNAQITAVNARIGICQGHIEKMNKAQAAYQTAIDSAPQNDLARLIVEASDAAISAKQTCEGVLRDPQKFNEVSSQILSLKEKHFACQSMVEKTLKLRDELVDFARQTRKSAEFAIAVKEFMSVRREADDGCEGRAQQQVRELRSSEFDFLSEEKACLPALRRAFANRSNRPPAGICKTKIYAKIAEDLSN